MASPETRDRSGPTAEAGWPTARRVARETTSTCTWSTRGARCGRLVAEVSGGGWSVADWSHDDRQILATEAISANESYLWLGGGRDRRAQAADPQGRPEKVAWGSAAFCRDGTGLYVATDRDSQFQRLAHLDLATGKPDFLSPDTADVDDLDVSPDGTRIAFVTNEKGYGVLHLLDTRDRREVAVAALPPGVAADPHWHRDGETIGISVSSARPRRRLLATSGPAAGALDDSETGGVNPETFVEPELVTWKSFDGRDISGFLYRPPAKFTGKPPVIDRRPRRPGGPVEAGLPRTRQLPDQRARRRDDLSEHPRLPGYGKTFLELDNGYAREDTYKDIGTLLDWIRTRPRPGRRPAS